MFPLSYPVLEGSLYEQYLFQLKPYLILFLQISSFCIFKLKESKTVSGYCQTQQYDPILQKYYLRCVAPCSEFCKDGLMMDSGPKHVIIT